jgi:hypothetical protein
MVVFLGRLHSSRAVEVEDGGMEAADIRRQVNHLAKLGRVWSGYR